MRQIRFPALALLFIATLILAACPPAQPAAPPPAPEVIEREVERVVEVERIVEVTPTPEPEGPRFGGTLTVAIVSPVQSLDPADYRDRPTETVLRNMFDGLVTRTTDNRVVVEIAEDVRQVDDATWDFIIRDGITFHDGAPLTVEDVKFTFDRIITEGAIEYPEPHTAARKGLIAPLQEVEIIDERTVRFHFEAPWPPMMQLLVHQQIVPKHYLEEVGTQGFIQHPIGAGPFRFVEGRLDDRIVMERYENYWGGAPDLPFAGGPYLDRVIFRVIPEASTRIASLLAGEVNIVQGVPPHLIPRLLGNPNIVVKTVDGTRPFFMEMNVTLPPFDDVRVRHAMNYAVNVDEIINTVLGGFGRVQAGPLSPLNQMVDPTLEPYGYDPERALELLAEAGYNEDNPLSFVIDVDPPNRPTAEAIASQLAQVGVDASVRVWDFAVLRPLLLAGERQATVGSWGDSAFDPVGYFEAKFHTPVEGTGYGRGNYTQYSNERVDELTQLGERTADHAERLAIYAEAQRIVYEDAPWVFLYITQEVEASTSDVMNWEPSPDGRVNLHRVWLDPDR